MITKNQLKEVYERDLRPKLQGIERKRKILKNYYIVSFSSLACTFLSFVPLFILEDLDSGYQAFYCFGSGFFFGILFMVLIHIADRKKIGFKALFDKEAVSPIIHAIEPNWRYRDDAQIGSIEYKASKLFHQSYTNYDGKHLVEGVIDKTDFKSSVLFTNYERNVGGKTEIQSIFNGFFFHADFNKHFIGETFVTSGDLKQQAMALKGNASDNEYIRLENPEFIRNFIVRSKDQVEARYILTPAMMSSLLHIKKQYKPTSMFLSFIRSRVYCAMSFGEGIYEPRIMKSAVSYKEIEKIYDVFALNSLLIKELNLNTRIWTKK